MESEQCVVPLSRTKIILLFLGSTAFVIAGIWLWRIAEQQSHYEPLYVHIVAVMSVAFFGLCGLFALTKLFDRRPGLIVDSLGIVDNSSGLSAGRIPWREIRSLRVSRVRNQRVLTLELEDPIKYVNKGNLLKRKMNAVNLKYFGSPIQTSANALRVNFDQLVDVIARFHGRHQGRLTRRCSGPANSAGR